MKRLLRACSPGTVDGLVSYLVIATFFMFVFPLLIYIVDRRAVAAEQAMAVVVLSAMMGMSLAVLTTCDAWILLGHSRFIFRWFVGFALGLLPGLALALGICRILPETGVPVMVFFIIFTVRAVVTLSVGIMSLCWQLLSGWRIACVYQRKPDEHTQFQTSIGEMMVLMSLIAIALVCVGTLWHFPSISGRGGNVRELILGVGVVGFEVVLLVLYVATPTIASFYWNRLRDHLVFYVSWWIAGWAMVFGLSCWVVEAVTGEFESLAAGVFFGHVGFGFALATILHAAQSGYGRVHATQGWEPREGHDRQFLNRVTAGVVAVFALFSVGLLVRYDLVALMESGSFRISKKVSSISRLLGRYPEPYTDYRWAAGGLHASFRDSLFEFGPGISRQAPRLIRLVAPGRVAAGITIQGKLTNDCLRQLQGFALDSFNYGGSKPPDLQAFDAFCRSTKIRYVALECNGLESSHIQSLQGINGLVDLRIGRVLEYSPSLMDALRELPVHGIALQVPDSSEVDMSALKNLDSLRIFNSRLTPELVREICRININPNVSNVAAELELHDCQVTKAAIDGFARLSIPTLIWETSFEGADVEPSELLRLADNQRIGFIRIVANELDGVFAAKFAMRRNGLESEIRFDTSNVDDAEMEGDQLVYFTENLGLDAAAVKLAHSVVRDVEGNITELNFQGMNVGTDGVRLLRDLSQLRRLRISTFHSSTRLFAEIAELESLRELEIPYYGVSDDGLQIIGTMKKLTRLQLPVYALVTEPPQPEQIPLPLVNRVSREDELDVGLAVQLIVNRGALAEFHDLYMGGGYGGYGGYGEGYAGYGGYDDAYGGYDFDMMGDTEEEADEESGPLSQVGIWHLGEMKELEYLFMPGFLLTDWTMNTIESLPSLRELHAVFSRLKPELLKRVCRLHAIEALSIGVPQVDDATIVALQSMPKLRTLQLFVFPRISITELAEKDVETRLRNSLPGCKVHVFFLPGWEE